MIKIQIYKKYIFVISVTLKKSSTWNDIFIYILLFIYLLFFIYLL